MALGWSAFSSRIFLPPCKQPLILSPECFTEQNENRAWSQVCPWLADSRDGENQKGTAKTRRVASGIWRFSRFFFFHSRFVLSRSLEPGTVQPECFITSLVAQQPHGLLKRLGEGDRELIPWILGYSKNPISCYHCAGLRVDRGKCRFRTLTPCEQMGKPNYCRQVKWQLSDSLYFMKTRNYKFNYHKRRVMLNLQD